MGRPEPDKALSDVALEQEIERALSVEPSPEFVARVRGAVATASMRAPWPRSWAWFGVATAAAGVAVAIVLTRSEPLQLAPLLELPRTHVVRQGALPSLAGLPRREVRTPPGRKVAVRVERKVSAPAREPEVLIAQDEAAALKRLMRGWKRGRVDPSTLEPSGVQQAGPPPTIVVLPIPEIAAIAIDPLGFEGGARQ